MGRLHAESTHGTRGLLIGSLLTAIPFFVIHIPNAFAEQGLKNTSLEEAALNLFLIDVVVPFFRYLLGTQLIDSGGGILAIGLLHASFNAAGQLSAERRACANTCAAASTCGALPLMTIWRAAACSSCNGSLRSGPAGRSANPAKGSPR